MHIYEPILSVWSITNQNSLAFLSIPSHSLLIFICESRNFRNTMRWFWPPSLRVIVSLQTKSESLRILWVAVVIRLLFVILLFVIDVWVAWYDIYSSHNFCLKMKGWHILIVENKQSSPHFIKIYNFLNKTGEIGVVHVSFTLNVTFYYLFSMTCYGTST